MAPVHYVKKKLWAWHIFFFFTKIFCYGKVKMEKNIINKLGKKTNTLAQSLDEAEACTFPLSPTGPTTTKQFNVY